MFKSIIKTSASATACSAMGRETIPKNAVGSKVHRFMGKVFYSLMIAMAIVCFTSCGKEEPQDTEVTSNELIMIVGEEYPLNEIPDLTISQVQSNNPSIVTIEGTYPDGKVLAKAPGKVIISAKYESETVSYVISVYAISPQFTYKGIIWAAKNVDIPGSFTANATDRGMLYQWNRKIAWYYDKNSVLQSVPNGSVWDDNEEPGTSSWSMSNDPCPTGWRLPTYEEAAILKHVGLVRKNARINNRYCDAYALDESNTIVFPIGELLSPNGVFYMHAGQTWTNGYTWTSTRFGGGPNAYYVAPTADFSPYWHVGNATVVRCVKK